nr:MAG TPA: hypothetical protein [Bacteriophage sp.]
MYYPLSFDIIALSITHFKIRSRRNAAILFSFVIPHRYSSK